MIYDMNPRGMAPRDRLDARLFEEPAASCAADTPAYTADGTSCAACARCDGAQARGAQSTAPRLERPEQSPCAPQTDSEALALAMVYSPYQAWQNIYCEQDALMRGTIFEELDKPFYGPACMGGGIGG